MAKRSHARWLWLTLAVIAADRATKFLVERRLAEGARRELIANFAALVHAQNPGIAFSMFSESSSHWVVYALMGSSAVVVALLVWLIVSGHIEDAPIEAGLALIAGGAAGNLLDRLLHGGVTDFLELHAGRFFWPAFNLADSAITVGAVLLAFELIRDWRRPHHERA